MSLQIAVCFEYGTVNGGENSFLAVVPELRRLGFEMTAVAPAHGTLAVELGSLGIRVEPWRLNERADQPPPIESRREALRTAVKRCQPDFVHANSLNISRLLGPVVAELKIPSLGYLRDIIRLSAKAVSDLRCHGRLIAVSESVRAFHVAQGLESRRVHVVHNGVDLERFQPRPQSGYLHRELGIERHAAVLGGVGQLGLRKGWDVALSAFAQVSMKHRAAHLVIAGEQHSGKAETREYVRKLHAAAKASELRGRVHFLGRRSDIPSLMTELTALIHPARQEPLGRVLLEAAAAGLPIVTTDVGGTREIFPPGAKAALVIQPDAPNALAHEISRVLEHSCLRETLGQSARRQVERRFRLGPCAAALAKHYTDAIKARPGGEEAT